MSLLTHHSRIWGVGLGALFSVGASIQACGPSVQFIYEGNIRFEHCYRLDFDENIAPTHRKACWEDWLHRYPKAQTRDRLEYAQRRINALTAGERTTLTLHLPEASDASVVTSAGVPAPVPTNLHVPPPARMVVPTAPLPSAQVPSRSAGKP